MVGVQLTPCVSINHNPRDGAQNREDALPHQEVSEEAHPVSQVRSIKAQGLPSKGKCNVETRLDGRDHIPRQVELAVAISEPKRHSEVYETGYNVEEHHYPKRHPRTFPLPNVYQNRGVLDRERHSRYH